MESVILENNVICIKWGTKFGSEYVNRLYRMVEKNLSIPHRFVCFTDNGEGLDEGIEVRELPPYSDNPHIGDKGWRKLSLFNSQLADLKGRNIPCLKISLKRAFVNVRELYGEVFGYE